MMLDDPGLVSGHEKITNIYENTGLISAQISRTLYLVTSTWKRMKSRRADGQPIGKIFGGQGNLSIKLPTV